MGNIFVILGWLVIFLEIFELYLVDICTIFWQYCYNDVTIFGWYFDNLLVIIVKYLGDIWLIMYNVSNIVIFRHYMEHIWLAILLQYMYKRQCFNNTWVLFDQYCQAHPKSQLSLAEVAVLWPIPTVHHPPPLGV